MKYNLQHALNFLVSQQADSEHCFAGAFACILYADDMPDPQEIGQVDWTIFNTALAVQLLRDLIPQKNETAAPLLTEMLSRAKVFLRKAALDNPEGSYGFWPSSAKFQAAADLDDTALAYLALTCDSHEDLFKTESLTELAWRLFAPYRIAAGTPLATGSRWAAAYPGVFQTWMSTESHAVVDATVIAHICRLLLSLGLTEFPGLQAGLRMLMETIEPSPSAIPIAQLSPYYRSKKRLWAACSKIPPIIPDAIQLREKLSLILQQQSVEPDLSFEDRLWLVTALHECGVLNPQDLKPLVALQQSDGGWPRMPLCNDVLGRWHWASRVLSTLLILNLLEPDLSTLNLPASNIKEELAHPC